MKPQTAALVALVAANGPVSPQVLLMLAGQQKITHRHIAAAVESRALHITVCVSSGGNSLGARISLGPVGRQHQADKEANPSA